MVEFNFPSITALASNVAHQQGSLIKGKKADFVVLSDNIFESNIGDVKINQVWISAKLITPLN